MSYGQIRALLRQKFGIIFLGGILLAVLTFFFLVISEKNFKVSTTFLIIQNNSGTQDYYSLSKSAEYISRILSESVTSELFINEAVNTGKVNREFLPFDKKNRLKEWNKMVNIRRDSELGILEVEIENDSQKEALAISQALAIVLTEKNNIFRGENENISVKILSGPIIERNPSLTKTILSALGGFVLGILIGTAVIYYARKNDYASLSDEECYQESLKYLED